MSARKNSIDIFDVDQELNNSLHDNTIDREYLSRLRQLELKTQHMDQK